jgi:sulfate transport system ATP-binding protein
VALARALAIEPSVLLLDEPLGALDPPIRVELRATLRELHDRLGLTTVLVTHDQEEAFELADRIAILRGGKLIQHDTPEELDQHPVSPFVFEFLGDGVQLPGVVRDGRFGFAGLPLPPLLAAVPQGPATALIRPNEISIESGDGPGTVVGIQRRLQSTRYEVELAGSRLSAELAGPPLAEFRPGARCRVAVTAARVLAQQGGRTVRGVPAPSPVPSRGGLVHN